MEKLLLLTISLILTFLLNAQIVNIPDASFKAVLVADPSINTNMDTEIQISEAAAYTGMIDVSYQGISDMTGIEAFTNLTALVCNDNYLTTLDLSNNTALTSLECEFNLLISINISNNTALTNLHCSDNLLTSIDLSTNIALKELYCFENQLTSLDLSNNIALDSLRCSLNQLTLLDLTYNINLKSLSCNQNQLNNLNISNCTGLYRLHCYANQLVTLDLSNNSNLMWLEADSNLFTSVNIQNGNNNILTWITLTHNPNLYCIQVDNATWSYSNWLDPLSNFKFDSQTYFSYDCTANPILILQQTITNATCNGNCDGEIDITISGGTTPYNYSWTGPNGFTANTEDITGLCAGTYDLTISDAVPNTLTTSITVSEPSEVIITLDNLTDNCSGSCNGSISVTATGGTPGYTYNWSNSANTEDINNLCTGPYTLTVYDGNLCAFTSTTWTISDVSSVNVNINANTSTGCEYDTYDLNGTISGATGGIWSTTGSGIFLPSNTDLNATYIPAALPGSYILTLTSTGNGTCPAVMDFINITIYQAAIVNAGIDDTICSNNDYLLSGSIGGSTLSVYWTSSGTGTFDNPSLVNPTYYPSTLDYANGSVALIITSDDPIGPCIAVSDTMILSFYSEITPSAILTNATGVGYCNGSVLLNPIGGTAPYSYSWDNGSTNNILNNLCGGINYVTITDFNNCTANDNFTITNALDSLVFYDTLHTTVDTCIFNNSIPVDSAWITGATVLGSDILFTWIFWQAGASITYTFTYPYSGTYTGNGLVYLTITCTTGTKAIYTYNFIDYFDLSLLTNLTQISYKNLMIFPNPTKGEITIKVKNLESVEIFNLQCKQIYKGNKNEIDLSQLSKGIYLIKVTTQEYVALEKVILE